MLDHVTIGVSDIERSKTFYDAVLPMMRYCQFSALPGCMQRGRSSPVTEPRERLSSGSVSGLPSKLACMWPLHANQENQ